MKKQERIQILELEEDTSLSAMKETLSKIRLIHTKADMILWEKKQRLTQNMYKIEATQGKLQNITRYFIRQIKCSLHFGHVVGSDIFLFYHCTFSLTYSFSFDNSHG